MKKLLLFCALGLLSCALSGVEITKFKTRTNSWDDAFSAALKAGNEVTFPKGKYEFSKTVEVKSDLRLVFAPGAEFFTHAAPGIRLVSGLLRIEGEGGGGIMKSDRKFENIHAPVRGGLIDLNAAGRDPKLPPAALTLRNMEFRAALCVDGAKRIDGPGKIGAVDIENCRFFHTFRAIGFQGPEVASVRVTDCLIKGGTHGIMFNAAIPGGAYVCGNILRNFGKTGIFLGKGGQIAEGCTTHLGNAIVHDNQLIQGGHLATTKDSYIHGILIYGHNVSVQGNIVRDVNRGVPVPGARIGHQIVENGKVFRERMQMRNGKRVRLAGSAIYLKANRSIVHSNICTNSGWRAVIEIKTGGKEYYTSVVNNVVDGRSLAVDESFAFECNAGRSLWANNIVYDIPHQAFVVRSGYENTFINNLIVNAKVGFGLSGRTPGQNELISGNRFIDVECPVALDGKVLTNAGGLDVHTLPPSTVMPGTELPEPSAKHAGRMVFRGSSLYCCVNTGKEYQWMEIQSKAVPKKTWRVIGPELALNADQSGREPLPEKLRSPIHPGWTMTMRSAREQVLSPKDGHVTFDTKNFVTGGRSLKMCFKGTTGEFRLVQPITLKPGTRYRATARVMGEEPRNFRLEVAFAGRFSEQIRAEEKPGWQLLTLDFTVPNGSGSCALIVRGSKTSEGKSLWLDSVSVRELQDASLPPPRVRNCVGPELCAPLAPSKKKDIMPPRWSDSPTNAIQIKTEEGGVLAFAAKGKKASVMISHSMKLKPGKDYRFTVELQNPDGLRAAPSAKVGNKVFPASAVSPVSGDGWRKYQADFTLPEGVSAAHCRVWAGNATPGAFFRVRNASVRELEK